MANQQTDLSGRAYAKLSELKAGDIIELDEGFTCQRPSKVKVFADERGILCFACDEGNHRLDGQADDGEHCVGVYGPL